jgi:glycosyltransferase involved in cell wall biosynthesis
MGISGVLRTAKFVKYLPKYGWHPIVLTGTPRQYLAYDEKLLEEVTSPDITIIKPEQESKLTPVKEPPKKDYLRAEWLRKIATKSSQTFFIPDNKTGWAKHALETAKKIYKDHPDIKVVYSSAPPFSSHLLAIQLRELYNTPTILDFRVPWSEHPTHFMPTLIHKRRQRYFEERAIRASDKIITSNREMKERLITKYFDRLTHQDISIIPNGFDPEDYQKANPDSRGDKKLRFVYSGLFQDDRSPKPFFQALLYAFEKQPELKDKINLRFIGLFQKDFEKLAEKMGLRDLIVIKGYKNHVETIQELLKSDVLWAILGNIKHNELISLGKLYEYVGCKKTIFGIVPEGASKNFVLKANGIVARPDSIEDIGDKIISLYSLWKTDRLPVPDDSFIEAYNKEKLTLDLVKEFEELSPLD